METIIVKADNHMGIDDELLFETIEKTIKSRLPELKKVLILPPDFTRAYSGAGKITKMYYELLKDSCEVKVMPALGTHQPMSEAEINEMFGEDIPKECFLIHNWRNDVVKIGQVPGEFVEEVSEGLVKDPIDVELNKHLLDKSYDLIISVGQVVPHEVVGMANYSKNVFVGCGGSSFINRSHMLGAFYGMERIMGRDFTPVRKVFDYAEEHFVNDIPLMYVLTVTTHEQGSTLIHGVFAGRERRIFEEAVKLSVEKNIIFVNKPPKKVVVFLEEKEFKSTWLGNKSVYRTRMAIDNGGELIVLAPGVNKFGEDAQNDVLIRKYGYVGRKKVLELSEARENEDLRENLSVAAHLIHGSSDGRFSITYAAPKLTREEVEGVNYKYGDYEELSKIYDPFKLANGFNTLENGEEIFFISNPALGLWADKARFE